MTHEPQCPYPGFKHRLACTCPGTEVRRLLDAGRPSSYDPERGARAEKIAQRRLEREGWRVLPTREAYARFKNPGLANAYSGDLLLLGSMGEEDAVEVKEITELGERTGNVLLSVYSVEEGRFSRVWAVLDAGEIHEVSLQLLRSRLPHLVRLTEKRLVQVPFALGHRLR